MFVQPRNMKYVSTKTLHHPSLNGKSAAQIGGTVEKHFFLGRSHVRFCVRCVLCEWTHTCCASVTACHACVWLCFHVWVSDSVYNWVSEYKLGQHIKSCVSCWSSFTRGTARSLNFPALQLVYSGTCQASPPIWKAFSMLLTSSQRETSMFFPSQAYSLSETEKKKIAIASL